MKAAAQIYARPNGKYIMTLENGTGG